MMLINIFRKSPFDLRAIGPGRSQLLPSSMWKTSAHCDNSYFSLLKCEYFDAWIFAKHECVKRSIVDLGRLVK